MFELEAEFGLRFSDEEMSLVAVIFGAWLMQETDLHEKQVVLLTGEDKSCEDVIEQQLQRIDVAAAQHSISDAAGLSERGGTARSGAGHHPLSDRPAPVLTTADPRR